MNEKDKILGSISAALEAGTITKSDLRSIMNRTAPNTGDAQSSNKLSAIDIMFYIAGIVFYAAIVALVTQVGDGSPAARILLSAGLGAAFWAAVLFYIKQPRANDIRQGMTSSFLLTGSLLLITGGFIIANEFFDFNDANFYAVSITLALLGLLHISFGWQIRRTLLLLMGTLLLIAAFPALVFGILDGSDAPLFINCLVFAASGGLLAAVTRFTAKLTAVKSENAHVFDPLSAFIVLMSLYVASYDDSTGLLWLLALILGIVGLFYLCITTQNKILLGSGSFFLVISIITISYRYFSDNVAISLLVSAAGLLGTAIMAANINRRYLK